MRRLPDAFATTAAVAALALAAGCGGDDDDTAPATQTGAAGVTATTGGAAPAGGASGGEDQDITDAYGNGEVQELDDSATVPGQPGFRGYGAGRISGETE